MDFSWPEEAIALWESARRFGREELDSGLEERDARSELDLDGWRKCAELGILGLPLPGRYGGAEHELPTVVRALEGLGYGCRDNGLLFSLGAQLWSVQMPILAFGSDEQKERYLPELVAGRIVGAHAVTEPEAGSDVFSLRTTATEHGSTYVLNGSKVFITSAPVADLFLVLARTGPSAEAGELTAFLVERGAPGLSVSRPREKLGMRTASMGDVVLEDCAVPAGQMLGKRGAGSSVFAASMEWERSFILAPALGCMQRQLEQCVARARARRQFGRPIGKNQSVASRIVDMQVRLDLARLLAYRTAWMKQAGIRLTLEPAQVKLHTSESWVQNSMDALQLHGADGYMTGTEVERTLRDALASRIYSGTSDIQRTIIASFLGL